MTSSPARPLVSICIPTHSGAAWIERTLAVSLRQTYDPLEVLVVDDASLDGTAEIAARSADPRVRVIPFDDRVGMAANWNRAVSATRGAYVKFLMQDDELDEDYVETMAALLESSSAVGLAFSPRRILLDEPSDAATRAWADRHSKLHAEIEPLASVNEGTALLKRFLHGRLDQNHFGEPTAVMVRRSVLVAAGLFNERLRQLTDLEMWVRIAARSEVGFVPRPLATFRVHTRSATASNQSGRAAWLDRVWLVEGLRQDPATSTYVGLETMIKAWIATISEEVRWAVRRLMRREAIDLHRHLVDILGWIRYRRTRPTPVLHPRLNR